MINRETGRELYRKLNFQTEPLTKEMHEKYLQDYEECCSAYDHLTEEYLIKYRLAHFFRGNYYCRCKNYSQGIHSFLNALKTNAPEATRKLIPDIKIKINLYTLYHALNDAENAAPLILEMIQLTENDAQIRKLEKADIYDLYAACNTANTLGSYMPQECLQKYLSQIKKLLLEAFKDITANVSYCIKKYRMMPTFIFTSILLLIETANASMDELYTYFRIIKQMYLHLIMNKSSVLLMYRTIMRLSCELKDIREEPYIQECISFVEGNDLPFDAKAEFYQYAVSFYYNTNNYPKGMRCLTLCLNLITQEWHSQMRYFDRRVFLILDPIQQIFLGCYDAIHKYLDIHYAYEKVLQFKALASLAGRERNRVLYHNNVNRELLKKIQAIQDNIAYLETEKIFLKFHTYQQDGYMLFQHAKIEDESMEFRRLEENFSKQFPQNISLTDISLKKVQEAIPDNSAVIEYFCFTADYEIHEFSSSRQQKPAIDIYILRKENGQCTLNRIFLKDGKLILKAAEKFTSILQKQSDPDTPNLSEEDLNNKENLRTYLYCELIKPVLPFIQGIKPLYIALDKQLTNLPLEILHDRENIWLEKKHPIIKIECARDFLFGSKKDYSAKGSLVIGNPKHSIMSEDDESKLPYSKIELQKVSGYCHCMYYSGIGASKDVFLSAGKYRNIHIAVHGFFDPDVKNKFIYSSCLLFAGINDWIITGKAAGKYGNGVMTADEISRMDLHSVELVVLSSCYCSINQIIEDKVFHGLISAFSEAGVRYVISHLWQADDFSTVILMDHFYYQYTQKKLTPPAALKRAKKYLRKLTVARLKNEGWFEYIEQSDLDADSKAEALQFAELNNTQCPFEDEIYWGGFSCYKCN